MKVDYKLLKNICLAPISTFKACGDVTETKDGIYIYHDNPQAKILGVAHLDSVLDLKHFYTLDIGGDSIVVNAQLDDRLGAYTMLDLLPRLGIQFDLLLTEGEERGRSTAAHFEASKDYNWMFSFDRKLDDVVMYQYDCKELSEDLKSATFKPAQGSFSDIAFMDHLGVRGFNVGTGYYGEHSKMCYASMDMLMHQIARFKAFYETYQDKQYPYEAVNYAPSAGTAFSKNGWAEFTDDICYVCQRPSMKGEEISGVWICAECLGHCTTCAGCDDIVSETELQDGLCKFCRGDYTGTGM